MPTSYPVPRERTVSEVFAGLVGHDVRVAIADADDPQRETPGFFAEYVTDDDQLVALGFADHMLVNSVGAALAEIAPEAVAAANQNQQLEPGCIESFREVVNILASALNSPYTSHVRFLDAHVAPGPLPDPVKNLWRRPGARRAYRVAVSDEATGQLILYYDRSPGASADAAAEPTGD